MEAFAPISLWSGLLPTGVHFSAGFETAESATTDSRDTAALHQPGRLRTREFALGRWHARRALGALGRADAPLPRQDDGAPNWPDGVVGSIAHTVERGRVFAVAAVAPRDVLSAIGIDVEAPGRIAARAWPELLTSAELMRVAALPVGDRSQAVLALWCAKEAVAKATRPLGRIEVISIEHDREGACFMATLPASDEAAATDAPPGACLGRVLGHAGWTFAVATRAASKVDFASLASKAGAR